jgi:4-diphosphocytidyl-2-C-methyl-D-erythritol kinase
VRLTGSAPGKVNLCLFLGELRADGRHELVTLFESVSLADELELRTLSDARTDEVVCPGVEGPNLVSRALAGLRARGWDAPPVRIEIRKHVPVAAGMGGGSADAAAALRLAQRLAPLPDDTLLELAAELGADVPSQLTPGVVLGTGAGDVVEPSAPLAAHALVLVPQPIPLSTAEVYLQADRLGLPREADELAARRRELVSVLAEGAVLPAELLTNDLQAPAISLCPQIEGALHALRAAGADHAIVCGSGPTVAGIYWGERSWERAVADAAVLNGRFPATSAAVSAFGHNLVAYP